MKKVLMLLLAVCISATMLAADIIVTKDSQRINAKIEEVGLDVVRYRRSDNLTGPIYSIAKSDIQSITYENGYVETFNQYTPAKPSVVVQPQNNTNANIPQEILRNRCEEDFQKGRRLTNIGIGFFGASVCLLSGGIACLVDPYDYSFIVAGGVLTGIGIPAAVASIPLFAIGLHKRNHAYDAYKNMYSLNIEFKFTTGQNGVGIAMNF